MSKFEFSNKSLAQLATCHKDLAEIAALALEISRVDFTIYKGHRSIEDQQRIYRLGRDDNGNVIDSSRVRTNVDGIKIKSKHNYSPSLALDLAPVWKGEINWNNSEAFTYVAAVFVAVAGVLLQQGRVAHDIRWGGNWNKDGEIITGQRLVDLPHLELITPSAR